ncbi:MAG: hypothetical protein JWO67_3807 [Streptosporangiaceae bacterium]|nr:hypothetical protein [Streptosporangiaceae bacterium]
MPDQAKADEGAFVHKYSDEQVAHSRELLGREPEGADLHAHHDAPVGGIAGDHPHAGPVEDAQDSEGDA